MDERNWFITERWQQYDAERRANVLRIIAIGAFYSIHLLNYWSSQGRISGLGFFQLGSDGPLDPTFHASITMLAMAWSMLCLGIMLSLRRHLLPWWLKYVSTGCDLFLLSSVLYLASGPRSPLVAGYFLLIAMATLRMNLPLVRFTTVGSLCGYVCLLGSAKWPEFFGKGEADNSIPRYHQLIVLLALILCGVVLGQVVRSVRKMATEYQHLQSAERDKA